MILLIDAGNTRLKWRLVGLSEPIEGVAKTSDAEPLKGLLNYWSEIDRILISTVASEDIREQLHGLLLARALAPIEYCWAESSRDGLTNSYRDVSRMGADRWHAMLAGWSRCRSSFAVVDAGSAVTVDYVSTDGRHLGGYILPGLQMMRRSLEIDAARIGFERSEQLETRPGNSTGECVNHGLAWLSEGLVSQVHRDVEEFELSRIYLTGGDALRLQALGLKATVIKGMVLDGLESIAGVVTIQ